MRSVKERSANGLKTRFSDLLSAQASGDSHDIGDDRRQTAQCSCMTNAKQIATSWGVRDIKVQEPGTAGVACNRRQT